MKCEHCGRNEATFFYKSSVNGHVTQVHLCQDCAQQKGNAVILHGDSGQIGNHDGHHKFRRFHLSDLPLAHEPDHQHHGQV